MIEIEVDSMRSRAQPSNRIRQHSRLLRTCDVCPPYCTDAIDANRYGIPTCVYSSGGGNRRSLDGADPRAKEGELVLIDDMVSHAATIMRAAMHLNDIGLDKTIAMRGTMPSVAVEAATVAKSSKPAGAETEVVW